MANKTPRDIQPDGETRRTRSPRRRRSRGLDLRLNTEPGASPGTIVVEETAPKSRIRVVAWGPDRIDGPRDVARPRDVAGEVGRWPCLWVNVDGLGDAKVLEELAEVFGLHRLLIEDVGHTHQRVKLEDFDDQIFIVARMIGPGGALDTEQFSVVVGADFVLTFQEREGDCFDPIRRRLQKASGRLRARGPDYLAYALLDALTDSYFPVLVALGERLEALEDETLQQPGADTLGRIHAAKRELMVLRRVLWPLRDLLSNLLRDENPLIAEDTRVYLRDCQDHAVQLLEFLENCREVASSLMDVYLSTLSARMTQVMKVLTMVSTIFIPLTFVAGVYGMNFDTAASPWNMPELGWYLGYPLCIAVMLSIGAGMLWYFRRIGWLGQKGAAELGE